MSQLTGHLDRPDLPDGRVPSGLPGAPGRVDPLVGALTVLAVVARLPFFGRALSSDEGGFLLVASQWAPGHSLYGNYWVDRPPLLIGFFELVGRLGPDRVALRLAGLLVTASAVLLAARLGHRVADLAGAAPSVVTRTRRLAAATAVVFLVTPLFDAAEVNGELIAVPLVLLGLLLLVEAAADQSPRRVAWLAFSGAVGAAAVLVKQNEVDVLVAVAVASVSLLPHRSLARVARHLAPAVAGALVLTALVLTWAALRGTGPLALWDAVVTFRLEAARVLASSTSVAATVRFHSLLVALLLSGVVLVPLQLVLHLRAVGRGPLARLRWPVLAVLAWETFSVLGGGSYWLHYLVCLVPGTVLAVALLSATSDRERRWVGWGITCAAVVAAVSLGSLVTEPLAPSPTAPVAAWLSAHAAPGDTAVVAFGSPDILLASGLSSPYPDLWSLPVRVQDPQLTDLARVLRGPGRPTWVVALYGSETDSLGVWELQPAAAEAQLAAHYRLVADVADRRIYLENSRPLEPS